MPIHSGAPRRCSTRFMYSAVHTKPLWRLQNLSKEAPGLTLALKNHIQNSRHSAQLIYSTIHMKPPRRLQILTKKIPGSNLTHSNLHFTLAELSVVCNRVVLFTRNLDVAAQRGCVHMVKWTDDVSMTSFGTIQDSSRGRNELLTYVLGSYMSLVLHAVKASVGVIEDITAYPGIIFCTLELRS